MTLVIVAIIIKVSPNLVSKISVAQKDKAAFRVLIAPFIMFVKIPNDSFKETDTIDFKPITIFLVNS